MTKKPIATARPCACRHATCKNWHVSPFADVQGVNFTERQARYVATMLNYIDLFEPFANELAKRDNEA